MARTNFASLTATVLSLLVNVPLQAQDAHIGVTMPMTISGQLLHTRRAQAIESDAQTILPSIRVLANPSLKLGDHWYASSTLQISGEPYSYYETYYPDREFETRWIQAFFGYRINGEKSSLSLKVGKMTSAFGEFPVRYDDSMNPLIDQPLGYGSLLKIRPDALPCGTKDLPNLRYYEEYAGVHFYCGGPMTEMNGTPAVNLYGIPGAEVDLSLRRFDARFQITNSAPSNPQALVSSNHHLQWTAGGGWTPWQGLRIGASGFRGPFMDNSVEKLLPASKHVEDYPASAVGVDAQWARGRLSTSGEWYRATFSYPRLFTPLTVHSGYGEMKVIVTPRTFAAFRGSLNHYNRLTDKDGLSPLPFQSDSQSYEVSVGYRPNRWQLLKVGYEWLNTSGVGDDRDNIVGVQFVTSLDVINQAIK
jgi:hypothetical protein